MTIIDDPFDIDNMDVQEQIEEILADEEEKQLESELEKQEELEAEEIEQNFKKARKVLNAKNLSKDLDIDCETYRNIYVFTKDGVEYKGNVVHQMDKKFYIFNVIETNNPDGKYKLKKFNIDEIKQSK